MKKISKRRIRKAKELLAKAEEQVKKKQEIEKGEREKRAKAYKEYRSILSKHRVKLASQLVTAFELETDPRFEVGEKVTIAGTVKSHEDYNGEKQTKINRITVK